MIWMLAQVPSLTSSDPAQWTALAAVIVIAIAFVYSAVKWPSDAKAERTEMTVAFERMVHDSHQEAEKERARMDEVVRRMCDSFDNAVKEFRQTREEDRKACQAYQPQQRARCE